MHFVVLALDFAPEVVQVTMRLPATLHEAVQAVQGARQPDRLWHFPRLIAADPQPLAGLGVFVACPAWPINLPHLHVPMCVDTARIDGRLFVALASSYMRCRQLVAVADLPANLGVQVFVGAEDTPLEDDAWCLIVPGTTVSFCMPDDFRADPRTLPEALVSNVDWREPPGFLTRRPANAYCLVHAEGNMLHLADYGAPTAYRSQIAAAVGTTERLLRLFPAVPRVTEACVNGVVCRAVLAVCELSPGSPHSFHGVLVDLRFLLRGWQVLHAPRGRIDCATLLADLQPCAPIGWRVVVRDLPRGTLHLDSVPGQVLTIGLAPDVARVVHQQPADGFDDTPDVGPPVDGGLTSASSQTAADPAGAIVGYEAVEATADRDFPDVGTSPDDEVLLAEDAPRTLAFASSYSHLSILLRS